MTGNELLALVDGGLYNMEAGDVYILVASVPDDDSDPVYSVSVAPAEELEGDSEEERLTSALRILAGDAILEAIKPGMI